MREYIPILMFLLIAIAFAGGTILMSSLIVPRRSNRVKMSPYECGVDPVGDARDRFSIKFYLVAVLFILFDIETVFLIPWATIFMGGGGTGTISTGFLLIEMLVFLLILFVGYIYVWKRGAFQWD